MSQVALNQQFQEKVFERIRASIGDLMTEDDLRSLVQATMQKAFFEPVAVKSSYSTTYEESHFLKMMRELVQEQLKTEVKAWMRENEATLQQIMRDTLRGSAAALVGGLVKGIVEQSAYTMVNELRNQGFLTR